MAIVDPRLPRPWQPQNTPTESDFSRLLRRLEELFRDLLRRVTDLEGAPAATGSGATYGTGTIDFGAAPGTNIATVAITGLTTIAAGSNVQLWIAGSDSTASHTAYEHKVILAKEVTLCADTLVAGVGFTATAITNLRLSGLVAFRYAFGA